MCFTLIWVEHLIIQLVVLAAVVAIIRLLVPAFLTFLGSIFGGLPEIVAQVINIVLWVAVAIWVIRLCFDLITCLLGSGRF